jgi:hypothetical protein
VGWSHMPGAMVSYQIEFKVRTHLYRRAGRFYIWFES